VLPTTPSIPSEIKAFYLVKRYDAGGMSSGYVSPEWWRKEGIPLLKERFFSTAN